MYKVFSFGHLNIFAGNPKMWKLEEIGKSEFSRKLSGKTLITSERLGFER